MSGRRSIVGPRPGEIAEIDRELIIGREGDVTIDDPEVSRRHAAVRPTPQGVELEDLGSSNGTFVDGRRIAGRTTLTASATVRVGASELRIEIAPLEATRVRPVAEQPPGATRAPPVEDERPAASRDSPREAASAPAPSRPWTPLVAGALGVVAIAVVAAILLL